MKKQHGVCAVIIIVIALASFIAGQKYATSASAGNTSMLGTSTGQGRQGGTFSGGTPRGARGGNMGGFVSGEILSTDNTSITLKLRDGGSRIVFFSTSTQVMKTIAGATSDLMVGTNVMTQGTASADGSVIAESIQIRPASTKPQQ